ncbi:sensor histidine kinase [Streptomyces kanamyceticus]|uniref:Sensor histidine kinase n=1 Tax=Streptomyces kanamyceticus TaxID=1967 RepID=A0A5J6GMT6_STRKN|nr:sensor histidine kinase [Streptomyces kanamyceticus]QEU96383.1 sensor histidine kinase [Streptomyces kanamyceticus]
MTCTGFVHQALCYDSDDAFLAGTVDFVREGLAADDAVLAVVDRHNVGLLRDALGGAEKEVDYVDAVDWYGFPSRTLGRYHDYCTEHGRGGARRVRVIGEPVWTGRTPFETSEWIRYESLVNVAFADSGHRILCPYDTRALPADVVAGIRRTHPELAVGSGEQRPSGRYVDPAEFVAECDRLGPEPEAPAGSVREVGFQRGESVAVRLAAAEFARRGGLAQGRARDMAAAVHEVAVNAVRFGGGSGVLRLWQDADWVVCEVADHGGGARAVPVEDAGFLGHVPPDPYAASGHGLWVVRQLSDLVTERISARGSAVRLYFRR